MASQKYLLPILVLVLLPCLTHAQLSSSYYSSSCPSLAAIVKANIRSTTNREKRMGASILRLFFHDCFVNGCDAGVLLDDNLPTIDSEKNALPNRNSLRGFEVIDKIKAAVDMACPGPVVSCADILTLAARDSVVELGGPSWAVPLGRRDARTANRSEANNLPSPFADLNSLISSFADKGFAAREMAAQSGAHSVGMARCFLFREHLYNGTNLDTLVASDRKNNCPRSGGDGNPAAIDRQSPNRFGNNYYQSLLKRRGLLHSDQELYNGGPLDDLIVTYSKDAQMFLTDFANAMMKMGIMSPLTGTAGEIRKNCHQLN